MSGPVRIGRLSLVIEPAEPGQSPAAAVDVCVAGFLYLDLVFTGLEAVPALGTEVRGEELRLAPGGVANVAVALRRLGRSVALVSMLGADWAGDLVRAALAEEGIDTTGLVRPGWRTPVTTSFAYGSERGMVTFENLPRDWLPARIPLARHYFSWLDDSDYPCLDSRTAAHRSSLVADIGWDASGMWSQAVLDRLGDRDSFLPNAAEAMAFARATDPESAAVRLADRCGTVVVKQGPDGAIAVRNGEKLCRPALRLSPVDTTGAGDVFDAAWIYGLDEDWNLAERLDFANLCAGLSTLRPGGSVAAPRWPELHEWIATRPCPGDYRFLTSHP